MATAAQAMATVREAMVQRNLNVDLREAAYRSRSFIGTNLQNCRAPASRPSKALRTPGSGPSDPPPLAKVSLYPAWSGLMDVDLQYGVGMLVTPVPVGLLVGCVQPREFTVLAMILP